MNSELYSKNKNFYVLFWELILTEPLSLESDKSAYLSFKNDGRKPC